MQLDPILMLILTIFQVVWLCAVLYLLFAIWRSNVEHTRRMEKTLTDAVMKSAEAAHTAALAAQTIALVAQMERQEEGHES